MRKTLHTVEIALATSWAGGGGSPKLSRQPGARNRFWGLILNMPDSTTVLCSKLCLKKTKSHHDEALQKHQKGAQQLPASSRAASLGIAIKKKPSKGSNSITRKKAEEGKNSELDELVFFLLSNLSASDELKTRTHIASRYPDPNRRIDGT